VLVWESDGKWVFPKLNFKQYVNRNIEMLGGGLCSPGLGEVALLEDT